MAGSDTLKYDHQLLKASLLIGYMTSLIWLEQYAYTKTETSRKPLVIEAAVASPFMPKSNLWKKRRQLQKWITIDTNMATIGKNVIL